MTERKKQPDYWIKQFENGWRVWVCPKCGGKLRGSFYNKDVNPYHFCAYCGKKLQTKHIGGGRVWQTKD